MSRLSMSISRPYTDVTAVVATLKFVSLLLQPCCNVKTLNVNAATLNVDVATLDVDVATLKFFFLLTSADVMTLVNRSSYIAPLMLQL